MSVDHGIRPTIYYCNPNIYPLEEYNIRKDECTRYAQSLGLDIVDADYDHASWRCTVAGLGKRAGARRRCLKCFKMRLADTARYAHEHGFSVITTTLASSRWKSLEQINEAGHWAVAAYPDVTWWEQNWRKGGLSERRIAIIKEYNSITSSIAVVNSVCGSTTKNLLLLLFLLLRLNRHGVVLIGGETFYFYAFFFLFLVDGCLA